MYTRNPHPALWKIAKLRTFVEFKYTFQTEMYVTSILNRSQRSLLAHFICGILLLNIETGWFPSRIPSMLVFVI